MDMKTLEVIRKMDNFEKRLNDLTKEYKEFKKSVEEAPKKLESSKTSKK